MSSGPIRRTPSKGPIAKGVGMEGMRPMGRVSVKGRIVSARLNRDEIDEALTDNDASNDVIATLSDVAEALGDEESGGRRKLRGGGKTYDALVKLFNDGSSKFATAMTHADAASAFAIEKVPALLKTAVAGGVLKYTLNNPSIFANIAEVASNIGEYLISTPDGAATWEEYLQAGKAIGGSFASFLVTAAEQPTTPAGSVLIALFVMKYRAYSSGKSITDLIKSDAATVSGAAVRGAFGQYSEFLKAYKEEAGKVTTNQLKEIAEKAKASVLPGPRVNPLSGMPGLQSGPPGEGQEVDGAFVRAMKPVPGMLGVPPPGEAAKRLAGIGSVPERPARFKANVVLRQGGKKTKKVKSKRSTTRRRKAPKYLAAPVFAY